MGRGRGRQAIPAALGVLAVGLLGTGCGTESHPNEPRPPIPAEVSVNITEGEISAQPGKVGVKGTRAPLTQNQEVEQPQASSDAPLVVTFTSSNTTTTDTTLEVRGSGGFEKRSGPVVAGGNNVFKVALPTGHYTLEAADLPGAKPEPFYVGSRRVSSQNTLLLP
ncbi:MAG: hypothetical protein ACRDKV_07405 [Solirubrobacterales bacterium]